MATIKKFLFVARELYKGVKLASREAKFDQKKIEFKVPHSWSLF
jgi:hypothetical protein